MKRKIAIERKENDLNICIYEDGNLVEEYTENINEERLEGNIYLGKVMNVIDGMQSAFIDIGIDKNALIHKDDLVIEKLIDPEAQNAKDVKMSQILKPNDSMIIQIKKDKSGTKGPKATREIKLMGKYVIVMPYQNIKTISKKITDESERKRIMNVLESRKIKYGIIARTLSENATDEEINTEINELCLRWDKIREKAWKSDSPELIYNANGILGKLLTDFDLKDLEIVTNDKETLDNIKKIINKEDDGLGDGSLFAGENAKDELYEKYISEGKKVLKTNVDIIFDPDLKIELERKRKIWINCGGFITIDKTEALVAIDVNSGKFVGKDTLEKSIFKVNSEAAIEIAKEIRLLDLGGIIVIDFIDMDTEEDRDEIKKIIEKEFLKDRARVQVFEFTKLGLLEITRKPIFVRE